MKNLLAWTFIMSLFLIIPFHCYAQDGGGGVQPIDVSSFAGIVALVSLVVTQGAKLIPFINATTLAKIATSIITGIAITFVAKAFGLAEFLQGLVWWHVLIQGTLAGLSASGIYDLLKSIFRQV